MKGEYSAQIQTLTTDISMTLCNSQKFHQNHVLCSLHYIWYLIKIRQLNVVPEPTMAWTRASIIPPPPCISYANIRNYYGPYAHCSLDKGVACAKHIQLPTQMCARAWYGCTLTSAHISKCMQTQDCLGNIKFSGSPPCWHKK